MKTPWGESQHEQRFAEGIGFVSTAGHGGILLSQERLAAMPKSLRDVPPFGMYPRKWFEEDCEVALVALAFPEDLAHVCDPEMARLTVLRTYPEAYEAWRKEQEVPA